MTHVEDTAVSLSKDAESVSTAVKSTGTMAMDLATKLDTAESTAARVTRERDNVQTAFDKHMLTHASPPPAPTPTPTKRRTLHGLGGGNSVRPGVELDRRYYGAGDKTKMINDTTANEGRNTVSWNSMKFPYPWVDMAKGKGDAWFVDIMKAVSEAIKPKVDDPDDVDVVWFSGHHEPEGDQPDERLWRDTQERLSLLVPGGSEGPIKLWLTTTGWNQELNTANVANLVDWGNLWPKNGDIYGISYDAPYNTYGKIYKSGAVVPTGEFNTKISDPYVYIDGLARRAKEYGVEAALGEWGYSDEMFALDNGAWRNKVMDRCITNPHQQFAGEAYFDTKLNSSHTWWLGAADSAKRKGHNAAMAARKGK